MSEGEGVTVRIVGIMSEGVYEGVTVGIVGVKVGWL